MSEEWFIQQLVLRAGNSHEALLSMFPKDLVSAIMSGPSITTLPLDLLAKVLSFIQLSDICNVRLTCVAFAEAMRKQHFWNPFILNALKLCIEKRKITNPVEIRNILAFNTFESPVSETLRQQVEWVFKPMVWTKFCTKNGLQYVDRRTHLNTNIHNAFKVGTTTLDCIVWYESARFNDDDGRYIQIPKAMGTSFQYLELQKGIKDKGIAVLKVALHEAEYCGHVIFEKGQWLPHGKGLWHFKDSHLEGEAVAHMGEPRFILQKEEWESVVKKRRQNE